MTVGQAIQWAQKEIFPVAGEDGAVDARIFVCTSADVPLEKLLLFWHKPLQYGQEVHLRNMVRRRVEEREPLQYIVGTVQFMGYELKCDPRALIPRFETEILVFEALRTADAYGLKTVLDLCTGSGCVAIGLAKNGLTVTASDFNEDALMLARENAERVGSGIVFRQGDLFGALDSSDTFDLIVSNPPYVRSADIGQLAMEIRAHEPHMALDGGLDGLMIHRRIACECLPHLRSGGWLLLEVGQGQESEVMALLRENFERIEFLPDIRGIPRIVRAMRRIKNDR